ncbi:MAG: HEPN domain-containing protein [Bacteroidetes bacterium]|nr:HEPN domain-containing protein [Bacteroidota bacterium]MBX7046717.1 HEPN domain-containing protein [Ignavibacteria bacterium]
MTDNYLKGWLVKANTDIKVMDTLLRSSSEDLLTDVICFHAQQAIEKFLKSYLISKEVVNKKTHNLEFLQDKCSEFLPQVKNFDFSILSNYSIDVRYGEDFSLPSDKEALEAYDLAVKVKMFILEKLELTEKDLIL